jgi:hypothetical protein
MGRVRGSGTLIEGYVYALLDDNWKPQEGPKAPINSLDVPEGQQLLHLAVDKLNPESWIGGIMGGIVDQIPKTYVIDAKGKEYMPIGLYGIAEVGRRKVFEMRYLNETERVASQGHLSKLERIKYRDLKGKYSYVFLFHVPAGAEVVRLEMKQKSLDLSGFNLVAPQ